ncbi:MAG: hypothetical protein V9E94_09250 [Microthrixaceae bacterium]
MVVVDVVDVVVVVGGSVGAAGSDDYRCHSDRYGDDGARPAPARG